MALSYNIGVSFMGGFSAAISQGLYEARALGVPRIALLGLSTCGSRGLLVGYGADHYGQRLVGPAVATAQPLAAHPPASRALFR